MKTLVGAFCLALLLTGVNVSAAYALETDQSDGALAAFRDRMSSASEIALFDSLSADQRHQLASYLLGETDPYTESDETGLAHTDFEIRRTSVVSESLLGRSRSAFTTSTTVKSKTVWASQSFVFAGITISKTTVRETYTVSDGRAKGISTYSCVVNQNSDPFAEVTASKDGAWVSGGKATAECLVTVKRGAPTPWGQVTWSTASNVQFVTGNGAGAVTSHGWR